MKLIQLLDKGQAIQLTILQKLIISDDEVKMKELANQLDISFPTLQKEVKNLQEAIHQFDVASGLFKTSKETLSLFLSPQFLIKEFCYLYFKQTIDFELLSLLYKETELSTTKLGLTLQLSEASVFRRMKRINQFMEDFEIQYRNKRLSGSELQIRSFFYQLFWQILPKEQIEKQFYQPVIGNLIVIFENQFHVKFSYEQYWKLVLWIGIMQKRLDYRKNEERRFDNQTIELIEADPFYQDLNNILARYLSRFALQWSQDEVLFLYLFFLSEALIDLNHGLIRQSPFLEKMIALNHQVFEVLLGTQQQVEAFDSYLLKQHVRVAFSKGRLAPILHYPKLLSDAQTEKMSACMTIIEENLTRNTSNSQWQMLDEAYAFIIDIYKRQQQPTLLVGVALEPSLQSTEALNFIQQELASFPFVSIESRNKEQDYDLLIADENTNLSEYTYQIVYFFSGQTSIFEATRLKHAIQQLIEKQRGR